MDYSFKVKTSTSPDKKERITTNIIRSGAQIYTDKEIEGLKQYDLIWQNK